MIYVVFLASLGRGGVFLWLKWGIETFQGSNWVIGASLVNGILWGYDRVYCYLMWLWDIWCIYIYIALDMMDRLKVCMYLGKFKKMKKLISTRQIHHIKVT